MKVMISFQAPTLSDRREAILELENFSKKRKWEDHERLALGETLPTPLRDEATKRITNTELQLESAPLPVDWQRCLNIKSGEIHFYNTNTDERTLVDPRLSPEMAGSAGYNHMSLDLELNLPCGSVKKSRIASNESITTEHKSSHVFENVGTSKKQISGGLTRSPSWLTMEEEPQEMATAVCVQCHMLVLLRKSSPACPNCKFMQPACQAPPDLFKQSLRLFR